MPNSESLGTVLIGFAEAGSAPEVAWSLAASGFRVHAFARRGRPAAVRHSRHVVCHDVASPETNMEATRADVLTLMRTLSETASGPFVLFPLDDTAVWLCSHSPIPDGWSVAGPLGAQATLALDKWVQVAAARKAGLRVPESARVTSAADAQAFARTVSFPIILKAADCVSVIDGRRQTTRKWICANEVELEAALGAWDGAVPLLAQQFVRGVGEGVFGLATRGGVVAWSAHRRLRMMNPQGSGSSACVAQTVPAILRQPIGALLDTAGWQGLFMIEMLRGEDGGLWFVELNGRPWGSLALARRQQLEYPAWHVRQLLGLPLPSGVDVETLPGLVCRHLGRELIHVLFVLRGPRSRALNGWPSVWTTLWNMLRVGPQDAVYNWNATDPRVLLADTLYTVQEQLFKPKG